MKLDNHIVCNLLPPDVETFLHELGKDVQQPNRENERRRLENSVVKLKNKLGTLIKSEKKDIIKSPRPVRKNSPSHLFKDSMHSFSTHLKKLSEENEQTCTSRSLNGSPISKRRSNPEFRQRSISCPEIHFSIPHGWRLSLPKVPETEETEANEPEIKTMQ